MDRDPLSPRLAPWVVIYCASAALVLALLTLSGQMRPWVSSDTESWLAAGWSWSSLGLPRFPLYGAILYLAGWDPGSALLPWVQDVCYILGCWALARAVHRRGLSPAAALATGLAPLLSCEMLLWGRAILPDVWAEAALLGAFAATLEAGSRRRAPCHLLLAALLGTIGYLLKPSLLPFAAGLPLLVLWDGVALLNRVRAAAVLLAGLLLPFLLIATLRLAVLGDFNLVSFGGFQMSGMAALMLTPDTVDRLPESLRPQAREIITRRDDLIAEGRALPIPRNQAGARSFASAAAGYFDILARTYDEVLYGAVMLTRQSGETWVAFNARLQRLALATVKAEPVDYAAWVAGALARLIGRLAVFNPGMVVGVGVILLGLARRRTAPSVPPGEMRSLLALVLVHTVGAALLAVLVTFPAARYVDGAGMLIAVLPLYAGFRFLPSLGARRSEVSRSHLLLEPLRTPLPDNPCVLQHIDPVRMG